MDTTSEMIHSLLAGVQPPTVVGYALGALSKPLSLDGEARETFPLKRTWSSDLFDWLSLAVWGRLPAASVPSSLDETPEASAA